jgi:hypothetical protein
VVEAAGLLPRPGPAAGRTAGTLSGNP